MAGGSSGAGGGAPETLAGAAAAGLRKRRRLRGGLAGPGVPAAGACGAPARRALDGDGGGEALAWEDVAAPASWGERDAAGRDVEVRVDLGGVGPGPGAGEGAGRRISAAEQQRARVVHRVHTLCLLGRGLWAERWARCPLRQARCLSLLPLPLHPPPGAAPGLGQLAPALQWLARPSGAAAAGEAVGQGLSCLAGASPSECRSLFFVSICRALGLPARLVCCLRPAPRHAAAARKAAEGVPDASGCEPWCWTEVLAAGGGGSRWVHVDPMAAEVDRPGGVESDPRALGRALVYVVGFFGEGGARDVTRRYSSRFSGADARQRDEQWWRTLLPPLESAEAALAEARRAAGAPGPAGGGTGGEGAGAVAREEAELGEKWRADLEKNWPRTLTAAKDHPVFCLLRHLNRHQAVRPGSRPTGKFIKGEPLYRRENVCELRTRAAWVRQGRAVREGEEPAGCSEAKGRGKHQSLTGGRDAADAADEAGAVRGSTGSPLFGLWQTEPWRPASVVEGRVPRNEYGNIECPPFVPALPEGTVHLRLPRVARVCRDLGVDHAVAMVGFERKQGRFFPAIEGVVVLQEHEPKVVGAYLKAEQAREYKALQARMRAAETAWGELLRLALAEHRVRLEFGGIADAGAEVPPGGSTAPDTLPGTGVQQVLHREGFLVETEEI